MNVRKYTWDEFKKDADLLARKVKGNNFQALLIITKGGLHLGAYLSQALNINYVDTICIKSYKDLERKPLEIIKQPNFEDLPHKLLIIDDIADSGETLKYVQDLYKAPTATLFRKHGVKHEPTFCIHEVEDDLWVQFPWEREEVKQ